LFPRAATSVVLTLSALSLAPLAGCGKWADKLACGEDDCFFTEAEWSRVAGLANVTATPPPRDPSNEVLPSDDAWMAAHTGGASALDIPAVKLGWLLYHDAALSGGRYDKDSLGREAPSPRPTTCGGIDVSCATCHDPQRYGSDFTSVPRNVSDGAGFYDVNIQQTLNAARFDILYWNGRADALWAQAAQVMESAVSMNGDRLNTVAVLRAKYPDLYATVFTDPLDALPSAADGLPAHGKPTVAAYDSLPQATRDTVTRVHANAAKAIGAYEWFLSSDGSAFDKFVNAGPSSDLISPSAKRGLKLFVGRASCIDCHRTPLFSDGRFHNIGVPQAGDHVPTVPECDNDKCNCSPVTSPSCLPSGAFGGLEKLKTQAFGRCKTDPPCFDDGMPDMKMLGAWRTPSLRDVAMTGPYMHDGVYATLTDVVWHYDQGGSTPALGTSELSPLGLSEQDRDDLVAFLETLTGEPGPADLVAPPAPAAAPDGGAPDGGGADGGSLCP
jgi:cytochrome c peroxidase